LKRLSVLVFFCICYSFSSTALATDTAVPTNPTTTNPTDIDLDDGTIGSPQYGCPSGTSAAFVYSNGESLRFGECVNTFAVSYAINQALEGTGVSIDKVHYQWKYIHCFNEPGKFCSVDIEDRVNLSTGEITDDTHWDELIVIVEVTDSSGNVVETKTWTMDTWYDWTSSNAHSDNEVQEGSVVWQIHEDNIEVYNHIDKVGTIRTPNAVGDVRFRISGYDKGNWDGYYGPIINDLKTWFTYRANPCNDTALYDPSCPGYATAYATWQYDTNCAANALYDPGCPGYATANYNAQCSADPLYDSGCPGYASAYYDQQCSADPLYDSGCDGYAAAYYTQQCSADPLYDSGCDGYAAAYLTQQCSIDTLYNSACPGYAAAYLTQQCALDSTHDESCPGYEEAYFEQQCTLDALHSPGCAGYDTAYLNQQCSYNSQYDSQCPGYVAPIIETDPTDIGTGTGDSIVDNVIATPDLPTINLIPAPEPMPEPMPEPEPEVVIELPTVEIPDVGTMDTGNTMPAPEPLGEVEQIEAEVEQQIEMELEIPDATQEQEESGSDVEQSMDGDTGTDENDTEGGTEDTSSDEVSEGNSTEEESTEEAVEETEPEEEAEESTEDEATEETEEESTEEESTDEEETTEEESNEEATDEDESEEENSNESEEETTEDTKEEKVADSKPKKVKKLSKKEKEAAKRKKMKEIIKEKLKKLAEDQGKATSLEAQQALQQIIAALINYVPGFNAYGEMAIPGVDFYNSEGIYLDKKIPENQRGLRNGLASELKWNKMVDEQYEGME